MNNNVNDNEKAIDIGFGNNDQLKKLVDDAISKMYDLVDEESNFVEAISLFTHELTTILSEHVATEMFGVDLMHFNCRSNDELRPYYVQELIDGETICVDGAVNSMFERLREGKIDEAHTVFLYAFQKMNLMSECVTKEEWIRYLKAVNFEQADSVSNFDTIVDDFEHWAGKYVLANRLATGMTKKGKVAAAKI